MQPSQQHKTERRVKGMPLSQGIAVGRVCLFNENRHAELPVYTIADTEIEHEAERLRRATKLAAEQIERIRNDVETRLGAAEAEIFVAHRMILEDPTLHEDILRRIRDKHTNAEAAVAQSLDLYESKLLEMDNEYIKERASDFGEIKRRLLDQLCHTQPRFECEGASRCQKGSERVVVALELTPSMTIDVNAERTIAFVTEHGGMNSHAAILARAMGIPAVSGIHGIREMVSCGTELLVNGNTGEVIVWPTEDTFTRLHAHEPEVITRISPEPPVPGLQVAANVSLVSDIPESLRMQAEGIGLYRTEFEIMAARRFFTEDELYERYVQVARAFADAPVVFRLFDIGSDKTLPFMEIPSEENPALGWRGARLLLGRPSIMRPQARALARVSAHGHLHVMYPMIVDVDQFRHIRDLFMEFVKDIPHGVIHHGIMFEVPAACLVADELMAEADFASIGTNDLTQYLFAVDRENEKVSYDYNPDRPAFWRMMRMVTEAAAAHRKPLSVCGEIAGEPRFAEKLLSIGINRISVSARRIPAVRRAAALHFTQPPEH